MKLVSLTSRTPICAVRTEIEDLLELHSGDLICIERSATGWRIGALMLRNGEGSTQPVALRRFWLTAIYLRTRLRFAVWSGQPCCDARLSSLVRAILKAVSL